jgi:6-phosphogluconolactonase
MKIKILSDESHLAEAAAELFINCYNNATAHEPFFNVCLSGGSTPQKTYELLATDRFSRQISWSKVRVFWGDERWVAPDQVESNFRMASEALLSHVDIPTENVHRFRTDLSSADAIVIDYFELLKKIPAFDLVFLGLGEDGHVASLFPDADFARAEKEEVLAVWVPHLKAFRFSLGLPILNHAKQVVCLVSGAKKAQIVKAVLEAPAGDHTYPVQWIKPAGGELICLMDAQAAQSINKQSVA